MNRIDTSRSVVKSEPRTHYEASRWTPTLAEDHRRSSLHPRVYFAPQHYEPNYAYPLLVWLHRPGADETELWDIMPLVSLRNYVAIALRGFDGTPVKSPQIHRPGEAYRTWPQEPEAVFETDEAVAEAVRGAAERFHIAPRRVFLAGAGAGGTMALRLGLLNPEQFAGVLSIGGPLPRGEMPLRCYRTLRRFPVWLAQTLAEHQPVQSLCADLRLIHSAGMELMLRQYVGAQELDRVILADMNRWIMERVTSARHDD